MRRAPAGAGTAQAAQAFAQQTLAEGQFTCPEHVKDTGVPNVKYVGEAADATNHQGIAC